MHGNYGSQHVKQKYEKIEVARIFFFLAAFSPFKKKKNKSNDVHYKTIETGGSGGFQSSIF
jgi:hypothetical protein